MEHGQEIQAIADPQSLALFVARLAEEAASPDNDWENRRLEEFLKAMSAWLSDVAASSGPRPGVPVRDPSWRSIAEMLWAATMYE